MTTQNYPGFQIILAPYHPMGDQGQKGTSNKAAQPKLLKIEQLQDKLYDNSSESTKALSKGIEIITDEMDVFKDGSYMKEDEITDLRNEIAKKDLEIQEKSREIKYRIEKIGKLEKEIKELKIGYQKRGQEIMGLQQEILKKTSENSSSTQEVNLKLDELNKRNKKTELMILKMFQNTNSKDQNIPKAMKENYQNNEYEEKIQDLTVKLQEKQRELEQINQQQQLEQENMHSLFMQLQSKEDEITQREQLQKIDQENIQNLYAQLAEKEKEIQQLSQLSQNQDNSGEIQTLNQYIQEKDNEIEKLISQIQQLERAQQVREKSKPQTPVAPLPQQLGSLTFLVYPWFEKTLRDFSSVEQGLVTKTEMETLKSMEKAFEEGSKSGFPPNFLRDGLGKLKVLCKDALQNVHNQVKELYNRHRSLIDALNQSPEIAQEEKFKYLAPLVKKKKEHFEIQKEKWTFLYHELCKIEVLFCKVEE